MDQLPLHQIFVYKNERDFSLAMFPPTASMIRERFGNCYEFWGDRNEIEAEPISCMYDVYQSSSSLYINLHDAYIAFKTAFGGYDDRIKARQNSIDKKEKNKQKGKDEMCTDDDEDNQEDANEKRKQRLVSEKEKLNHIHFRMSVDDLKFCGFIKAPNEQREVGVLKKLAECF